MFSSLMSRTVPHSGKQSQLGGVTKQYLTAHHWAGIGGGDTRLLDPNQAVSTNYILYSSGELVGQVAENMRAWTSGSFEADAPGVTVETQNIGGRVPGSTNDLHPDAWPVSAEALEMLAQLAADLCIRYGWGRLDRSRVRGHLEFAQTACPGGFLWARLGWIIDRGNEILSGGAKPEPEQEDEDDMNTYLEATSNSTPIKEKDDVERSRIWAGERQIGGMTFASVWERSADGSARRLFKGEWEAIVAAYAAADRKVPVAKVGGNVVEQIVYGKRA